MIKGVHTVFYSSCCDDIENTVNELRERGVEFVGSIVDKGYGLAISFRMPGGVEVELYEPRYQKRPRNG